MYSPGSRRTSFPVQSLNNSYEPRLFGKQKKKKKKKKVPCCETLPYDLGNREDDTPDDLKKFIREIEPEDSDDSEGPYAHLSFNERVRLRNKQLFGSSSNIDKDFTSSQFLLIPSIRKPRRGSLPDINKKNMDEQIIGEDEYQQSLAKEKMVAKFTEMEIVALWNQFKLNFPHGTVSKPQLVELLQKVINKKCILEIVLFHLKRNRNSRN